MAMVRNLKSHNLGWVSPYNGKPVLITESGSARRGVTADGGVRYLEILCNIHKWAFLAKKGFVSLKPKFRDMRIDLGFVVEGRGDEEMPECILGAAGMNYIDEGTFTDFREELQRGLKPEVGVNGAAVAPNGTGQSKANQIKTNN